MSYWVTLTKAVLLRGRDRSKVCVDAPNQETARAITVEKLGIKPEQIASVQTLPYPSEPRLNYTDGSCPSFCIQPDKCAGYSSCPKNYACSE